MRSFPNDSQESNNQEEDKMEEPSKKKRKMPDGSAQDVKVETEILANPSIMKILSNLKSYLLEFIEHITSVKIWIQLNVPRIEDGNNFGVGIQEEILGELGRAEEAALTTLEHIPKYYLMRAKYISKSLKYPRIEDYRRSILELDEKEYFDVVMILKDLKNHYSILHDMISKNWDRICKPRSENVMSLY